MSETTSESGQVHLADEPSMEDILDSIRKIIADDDQKMDIAPPQALATDLSEKDTSQIEPSLSPVSLISETVLRPSSEYNENSVFNKVQSESDSSHGKHNDSGFDIDDDTVDLDIEALLSEAETPLDSSENLSFESFSGDDDLSEMMDIEIPKQPEEELAESTEEMMT